jgi:hypothetical protein
MKSYKHLNKVPQHKFNWQSSMMERAMPTRAFVNELTRNIMLSVQAMLVRAFKEADRIKFYKSF